MPSLSNSPRIRSAPHSRLSLAISWIKVTVSWDSLGLREAAPDLYFHKSLKPWRCQREPRLWLNDDEDLFPAPNYLGQQDQQHAVHLGAGRPFHLSTQDDQLLAKERIFCDQFGLTPGKVSQRPQQERGGVRFNPGDEAVVQRLKAMTYQPLETGENPMHSRRSPMVKIGSQCLPLYSSSEESACS